MDSNAETKRVMRNLSRALSVTAERLEGAVEDVSNFLDVSEQVESVLEQEEGKGSEESTVAPSQQKNETPTQQIERQVQLGQGVMDPNKIMLRDKIVFFIGVVNIGLIGYWVGRSPDTYYHYWTFKCFILFTMRWIAYRKKGWHYLMFEICYVANLLGMAHVYWYPDSAFMAKLAFAYGAGPLMWSIIAMRNSLVFHSFDKMTTLMMHASPAITAWTLRWYPNPTRISTMTPEFVTRMQTASWYEMTVFPVIFYLLWVITYYMTTFVLLKHRIEAKGRATMFSLMVPSDKEKARRSPLARMVISFPRSLQPFLYLTCHGIAATLALLPTKLFYDYYWLHTAALLFCLGLAVWNGGNYYFKVFAKKYLAQLEAQALEASGMSKKES